MKKKTASDKIYETLKQRILEWKYRPGDRLTEEDLCRQFKVSRIPIRDALNKLVEKHLVEKIPNAGCSVKKWSVDELDQMYDFRMAIELFAIETLAESPEGKDEIREIRKKWQNYLSLSDESLVDSVHLAEEDENFHTTFVELLGNPFLIEAIVNANERLRFLRVKDITNLERLHNTARQHLLVIDALESGNGEQARDALRKNILTGKSYVESSLKEALISAYLE